MNSWNFVIFSYLVTKTKNSTVIGNFFFFYMHLHIYNHYFSKVRSCWSYLLIIGMIITTIEWIFDIYVKKKISAPFFILAWAPEMSWPTLKLVRLENFISMHYQTDNVLEKNKIMENSPSHGDIIYVFNRENDLILIWNEENVMSILLHFRKANRSGTGPKVCDKHASIFSMCFIEI